MLDFTSAELTAIVLSLKVATLAALASLPLGIATGWLLARKRFFGKALGEFGATITFVSAIPGETQTISSAIYGLLQVPGGDAGIWRLALVAVGISLLALLVSEWLVRRQRGEAH